MSAVVRLAVLAAAVAAPAPASPPAVPPPAQPAAAWTAQQGLLQAQQDLAARQAVIQQNDLFRLETQLRTEQNLANLRAMGPPPLSAARLAPGAAVVKLDASSFVAIPDSALAASNARVRAAAGDRP